MSESTEPEFGLCHCGCGGEVRPGRRYLPRHSFPLARSVSARHKLERAADDPSLPPEVRAALRANLGLTEDPP